MPAGIEKHKEVILCPACHAACHLKDLSAHKGGKLFYSDVFSQANANLISIAMAVLLETKEEERTASKVAEVIRQASSIILTACDEFKKHLDAMFLTAHPKVKPVENYGRSTSSLSVIDPIVYLQSLSLTKTRLDNLEDELTDEKYKGPKSILDIDPRVKVFVNPGILRQFAKNPAVREALWSHFSGAEGFAEQPQVETESSSAPQ